MGKPTKNPIDSDKWQKTSIACESLGVKRTYLTRLIRQGALKKNRHYINLSDINHGVRPSYRWNIEAIKRDFLS